jgi:hypothetical protein
MKNVFRTVTPPFILSLAFAANSFAQNTNSKFTFVFTEAEKAEIRGTIHPSGLRQDVWEYIQTKYPQDQRKKDAAVQAGLSYQQQLTSPLDARKNVKENDKLLMCSFFLFGGNENSENLINDIRDHVINTALRSKAKLSYEYSLGGVIQSGLDSNLNTCKKDLREKYAE